MSDHDAELDAILEGAEKAGLVEVYVDAEGQRIMRLTPKGEQVARQLTTTDEDGQDAVVEALLEDHEG
jgi:DNA-binding MarR family transcriptional regulator